MDYLRFMPQKTPENRFRWWAAVISVGPGWVVLGALKQMGGAILAVFIINGVDPTQATEPIEQSSSAVTSSLSRTRSWP